MSLIQIPLRASKASRAQQSTSTVAPPIKALKGSIDPNSTNAFISAVLILLSKLNGRSTDQFKIDMGTWTAMSSQFMTTLGIRALTTKIFNIYALKGNIPEEMALELGRALKDKRVKIEQNTSLSMQQVRLLKDIDNQLRTQSVAAWNRIHKDVKVLGNPKLSALFPLEDEVDAPASKVTLSAKDVKKVASALQPIVKRLTGRNNHYLTIEEGVSLRASDPETAAKYSALTKQLNATVKRMTFNYVRSQGVHMVEVEALKNFLAKEGVPNNLPTGFLGGQIDDMGKFYTAEGRPIDAAPLGVVRMNDKYDPALDNTYVMSGVDHRRRYRTTTFTSGNKVARFSLVRAFIDNEAEHRKSWIKGLSTKGREPILAAMVELIWATSSRIGGQGNATAGEPTYGMSTLQVRHLEITPTYIAYDYTGKKLARQGAKYKANDPTSKKVHAILTGLIKDKAPTDNVFTYKGKPVLRASVNVYLKSLNIALSIHSFRRVAGTKLALELIAKAPFKASAHPKQAAVEKWFKESMKTVGELLHHRSGENLTGMTAIQAYIDPSAVMEFFTSLGLRKPSFFK